MNKFIIYGTKRTGSSLMVSLLDSHPEILCVGEAIKINSKGIKHYKFSYDSYRKKNLISFMMHYLSRDKNLEKYLNFIYNIEKRQ